MIKSSLIIERVNQTMMCVSVVETRKIKLFMKNRFGYSIRGQKSMSSPARLRQLELDYTERLFFYFVGESELCGLIPHLYRRDA